jgi:CBS domain-containing protein
LIHVKAPVANSSIVDLLIICRGESAVQASDIMTREVVTVGRDTAVDNIVRLLLMHRISGLPVVENGTVVGIISEGDLLRRPETGTERRRRHWLELLDVGETEAADYVRTHGVTAGDVMTTEVISVVETTPIDAIAEVLESRRIKRVPVLRDGRLVGIISRADLLRSLGARLGVRPQKSDGQIRMALLDELSRHASWAPLPAEVRVEVQDGVVHYWGNVRSSARRKAMIVAAERVVGIGRVEDHMVDESEPELPSRARWPGPGPA